jgi:hypothetical protein
LFHWVSSTSLILDTLFPKFIQVNKVLWLDFVLILSFFLVFFPGFAFPKS